MLNMFVQVGLPTGHETFDQHQTLQASRISRETHAFGPFLSVSRRETINLTPIEVGVQK